MDNTEYILVHLVDVNRVIERTVSNEIQEFVYFDTHVGKLNSILQTRPFFSRTCYV